MVSGAGSEVFNVWVSKYMHMFIYGTYGMHTFYCTFYQVPTGSRCSCCR